MRLFGVFSLLFTLQNVVSRALTALLCSFFDEVWLHTEIVEPEMMGLQSNDLFWSVLALFRDWFQVRSSIPSVRQSQFLDIIFSLFFAGTHFVPGSRPRCLETKKG